MQQKASEAKAVLRRQIRAALARMSVDQKAIASESARTLLAQQRVWQDAKTVLFFAPLTDELDLFPMIEMALKGGKAAALPRFVEE